MKCLNKEGKSYFINKYFVNVIYYYNLNVNCNSKLSGFELHVNKFVRLFKANNIYILNFFEIRKCLLWSIQEKLVLPVCGFIRNWSAFLSLLSL